MSVKRLEIRKTYKLYVGGAFIRSESGRSLPAHGPANRLLDNFAWASRKDFRDAVTAARGAVADWSRRTAYLRGQILYRAAEMLQQREVEMAREIERSTGVRGPQARAEVRAAVDRLVYYAGWTDKYAALFSSTNPVATSHFNFTVPEPTGVIVVLSPDTPSLLALISLVAPVILSGNTMVAMVSDQSPLPALTFGEVLATSDLPAGVVNLLAGHRAELAPHMASHMDVNAIVDGSGAAGLRAILQSGGAQNLKRYTQRAMVPKEWFTEKAEDPYWILDTVEFKTAWHPIGV